MSKKIRNDIILIVSILLIALIVFLIFKLNSTDDNLRAMVYYDNELVLEVDLDSNSYKIYNDELVNKNNDNEYIVKGSESELTIIVNENGIKVLDSGCSDNVCVNQGYISSSNRTITCLPNKVYIKLVGGEEVDVIVWV